MSCNNKRVGRTFQFHTMSVSHFSEECCNNDYVPWFVCDV
jgi:hypothetical protein